MRTNEQADRCTLYLGRDPQSGKTTFQRLENFAETGDPYLAALYFRFGRYLMISGSQPGTQPMNLQGEVVDVKVTGGDPKGYAIVGSRVKK